jgi:hypothetical protein
LILIYIQDEKPPRRAFLLIVAFTMAVLSTAALAQSPVSVIGPITPGDCTMFSSNTVIKDGGIPCPGAGGTLVLPNGTTATTQPLNDNTTKVATDAFVENQIAALAVPGGTNGQVQFNNAGAFGGLTNAQLTALVQTFTASLPGAVPASGGGTIAFLRADGSFAVPPTFSSGAPGYVPASGGGTTNFLRADGTFATPPGGFTNFQPVFNITSSPYNAKCNYGFKADIAMASGSTTATSASGWVVGDVGKYIIVAGAGAGGTTLVTTIASFTDSTHVVLTAANASGGAIAGKNAEYGNDDATAINSAIAAAVAAGGATVYIPGGKICMISQLNMTNITIGITLRGEGISSSRLMPLQTAAYSTTAGHVIDLTGSEQLILEDFQVGSFQGLAVAATGIFMAQVSSNVANHIRLNRIYISGQYSGATLYDYGAPSWDAYSSDFYNYAPGAGNHGVAYLTASNAFSYTSAFTTVATGAQSASDMHFFNCEFHKFGGTGADNWVVRQDGTSNIAFHGGVINGGATAYVFYDNTVAHISYFNVTFENEGPATVTIPLYGHDKISGTITDLNDVGSSYGFPRGNSTSRPRPPIW